MADSDRKQPIEVRVTEMPEAFTLLLKSLSDRLTAMETRENELRQTISDLEDRIDELEDGGEMMVGAGLPPVTNPLASAAAEVMADDKDTQIVDAQKFSQALGEQILAGSNDSDDFTIDNVKVEAFVGLGQDGETAQIATNAKKQVISQNASKVTFSVRRRSPTKIIK
ncbi:MULTISPECIES: hypothetical protein [unclassified Ruegeria]|uniref:hypothetical protein n=2 Tax=Ruegeria TaxID=97050 RepID=UPI0014899968|nr:MULTISPECIES: hypothetical protein [unclassified Ruegeria]NOD91077.1 hypothetical protein [Ruegeria sp. HKCCD4318]NOE16274.1 hypothetical protein [Ruegeria sp. HKCCD4318-2]NOG07473.1 hypothetical protein [Ruegeria sp. HKCCD4315]